MIDCEKYRSELLRLKGELEQRLARTHDYIIRQEGPLNPDFAEQAVERQNEDVIYGLDDSARLVIERIKRALIRMEEDRYGVCAGCGEEIQEQRLQLVPYAELCLDCAEVQEQRRTG